MLVGVVKDNHVALPLRLVVKNGAQEYSPSGRKRAYCCATYTIESSADSGARRWNPYTKEHDIVVGVELASIAVDDRDAAYAEGCRNALQYLVDTVNAHALGRPNAAALLLECATFLDNYAPGCGDGEDGRLAGVNATSLSERIREALGHGGSNSCLECDRLTKAMQDLRTKSRHFEKMSYQPTAYLMEQVRQLVSLWKVTKRIPVEISLGIAGVSNAMREIDDAAAWQSTPQQSEVGNSIASYASLVDRVRRLETVIGVHVFESPNAATEIENRFCAKCGLYLTDKLHKRANKSQKEESDVNG